MLSYMNRGRLFYKDVVTLALPIIAKNLITESLPWWTPSWWAPCRETRPWRR